MNIKTDMHSGYNSNLLDRIRHLLNPLHIYCRLTALGMPSKVARNICRTYETCLYKFTLGGQDN